MRRRIPRDPVPLSFALGVYGLLGFGGFADFVDRQVALLQSVASAWGDDWWYLAAMGWAHVEAGQAGSRYPDARPRPGIEHRTTPMPSTAVPTATTSRALPEEGEAFIDSWLPRYDRAAPLHGHLGWHQALFALQCGDVGRAVSTYLANVSPNASLALPMFTMIDCAAFAMRCTLYGHPLPTEELRAVAAFAERHFPKPGVPFVNVHQALTQAVAGRPSALAAWTGAVRDLLGQGRQASGPVVADVCDAVTAFGEGRFRDAASLLESRAPRTCPGWAAAAHNAMYSSTCASWRIASAATRPRPRRWLDDGGRRGPDTSMDRGSPGCRFLTRKAVLNAPIPSPDRVELRARRVGVTRLIRAVVQRHRPRA